MFAVCAFGVEVVVAEVDGEVGAADVVVLVVHNAAA